MGSRRRSARRFRLSCSDGALDWVVEGKTAFTHVCADDNKAVYAYIGGWLALLCDSPLGLKPHRTMRLFANKLQSSFFDVVRDYSGLAERLTKSAKRVGRSIEVDFIREMLDTPIAYEYIRWVKTRDSILMRYILDFLWFGKKINIVSDELKSSAFRDWLKVEDGLLSHAPYFSDNLRCITEWLTNGLSFHKAVPRNGSGRVSERGLRTTSEKVQSFGGDSPAYRVLTYLDPFSANGPHPIKKVSMDPRMYVKYTRNSHVRARLMFVPKSYKTYRSICMEPSVVMYFQQALMREIYQFFEDSPRIRPHIRLQDQSFNRHYAWLGSKTGSLDTIDLSRASDSVSWELVKAIFPRRLLPYLAVTRTTEVDTPNGIHHMRKYAPMGSALCFPIQCITFLAIAYYAAILREYRFSCDTVGHPDVPFVEGCLNRRLFHDKAPGLYKWIAVYGDDIICDNKLTDLIIGLLNELGFEVNESKSFTGDDVYRESCGGHYFDGDDVTPRLWKHWGGSPFALTSATLPSLCDYANDMGLRGYNTVRSLFIAYAINPSGNRTREILFVPKGVRQSCSIVSDSLSNTHLSKDKKARAMSVDYQDDYVRSLGVRSRSRKSKLDLDWYYLINWFKNPGPGSDRSLEAFDASVSWRWTPRYA